MHNHEAFSTARVGAIVVSAGSGSRAGGGEPKQYRLLGGKPVLTWSVLAMLQRNEIAAVVVCVPAGGVAPTQAILPVSPRVMVVEGGKTRTNSVRAGLRALQPHAPDSVLIHDAARPGLSQAVLDELLAALSGRRRGSARPARRRRPEGPVRPQPPLCPPRPSRPGPDTAGLPLGCHHARLRDSGWFRRRRSRARRSAPARKSC